MKKIVIGNWKMNPSTDKEAEDLLDSLSKKNFPENVEIVVCPPMPYLEDAKKALGGIFLGAQDVYWTDDDAFTGGISPHMLKDLGVGYVIVGHSERRQKIGETDEEIKRKFAAALKDGLIPILCVGETMEILEKGGEAAKKFILNQLELDLPEKLEGETIIAYEPVWSISTSGSGEKDTPDKAATMIRAIRDFLELKHGGSNYRVIYGGSVDGETAAGFLSRKEIDGALVGHASLDADEFKKIADAAA